jgi:hypothetical protein
LHGRSAIPTRPSKTTAMSAIVEAQDPAGHHRFDARAPRSLIWPRRYERSGGCLACR